MAVEYIYDSDGNVAGAVIPPRGLDAPVIKLGQAIQMGEGTAIVRNVEVRYAPGEFTTVNIELMLMNFGVPAASIQPLDFAKIFGAPEVAKAVNEEIKKQTLGHHVRRPMTMTTTPPPAPPYRPLPKIVARQPDAPGGADPLIIGDLVNIKMTPKPGALAHFEPFWRRYEVTIVDGENCRLVTPDKRFHMNADTVAVKKLRDLQRQLAHMQEHRK